MKRFILFVLVCLILVPAPVFAQDDISTLEDLIPYVQSLAERIEKLEAQIVPGVTKATWDGSDIVSTTLIQK
jgi:hydrogenase maturation factor